MVCSVQGPSRVVPQAVPACNAGARTAILAGGGGPMPTERLNVDLSADLAALVDDLVKAGTYGSGSEVVEDALRLLRARRSQRAERLDQIRKELDAAAADPVGFTSDEVRRHLPHQAA